MKTFSSIDPWITEWVLLGTLLLGAGLVIAWTSKRLTSAERRHTFLALLCLGLPFLGIFAHYPIRNDFLVSNPPGRVVSSSFRSIMHVGDPIETSKTTTSIANTREPNDRSWLASVWMLGFLAISAYYAISAWRFNRWSQSLTIIRRGNLFEQCQDITSLMGVTNSPRLLMSKEELMPMTWGYGKRHSIVLPRSASRWPEERLASVLRHELAHVARQDTLIVLLTTSCLALFWFHPLSWLAHRKLKTLREEAADDRSVTGLRDPREYANDLLIVVRQCCLKRHPQSIGIAMSGSKTIKRRVLRLQETDLCRKPSSARYSLSVTSFVSLLSLGLLWLSACANQEPRQLRTEKEAQALPLSKNTPFTVITKVFLVKRPDRVPTLQPFISKDTQTHILTRSDGEAFVETLQSNPHVNREEDFTHTSSTVSGKPVRSEAIREFIYPTEWDPPEIPDNIKPANKGVFPVTPAHPVSFDTRNCGFRSSVTPRVTSDSQLEVSLIVENTTFDGFKNYGSPITAGGTNWLGRPIEIIITENRIEVPVFTTGRCESTVRTRPGDFILTTGIPHGKPLAVEAQSVPRFLRGNLGLAPETSRSYQLVVLHQILSGIPE